MELSAMHAVPNTDRGGTSKSRCCSDEGEGGEVRGPGGGERGERGG